MKNHVIMDLENQMYWMNNRHYGYTNNDVPVSEARFSQKENNATILSKLEAESIIKLFKEFEFIFTGDKNIKRSNLIIKEVSP